MPGSPLRMNMSKGPGLMIEFYTLFNPSEAATEMKLKTGLASAFAGLMVALCPMNAVQAQTKDDPYGMNSLSEVEYMGLQRAFDLTDEAYELYNNGRFTDARKKLILVKLSWLDGLELETASVAELVVAFMALDLLEDIHWTRSEWDDQEVVALKMIDVATQMVASSGHLPTDDQFEMEANLQTALDRRADGLFETAKYDEALKYYRRSMVRAEKALDADPENPLKIRNVWVSKGKISNVLCDKDLNDECIQGQQDLLDELRSVISPITEDVFQNYNDETVLLSHLARYLRFLGRNDEALPYAEANYQIASRFIDEFDYDLIARQAYISSASDLTDLYLVLGETEKARTVSEKATQMINMWFPQGDYADGLAFYLYWMKASEGTIAEQAGDTDAACAAYQVAVNLNEDHNLGIEIDSLWMKPTPDYETRVEAWLMSADCGE